MVFLAVELYDLVGMEWYQNLTVWKYPTQYFTIRTNKGLDEVQPLFTQQGLNFERYSIWDESAVGVYIVTAQQGLYDVYCLSLFLLSSHREMLPHVRFKTHWSIRRVTNLVTQSYLLLLLLLPPAMLQQKTERCRQRKQPFTSSAFTASQHIQYMCLHLPGCALTVSCVSQKQPSFTVGERLQLFCRCYLSFEPTTCLRQHIGRR